MSSTSTLPMPAAPIAAPVLAPKPRLDSVDFLRGVVMVIMALDHVRGMVSNAAFDPTDLSRTNVLLFLTRWVTHFCAPTFVFLAGTGAFLGFARGKSKRNLAQFLWTRGLWLIVLEFTVLRFGWAFNFDYSGLSAMVIWAIGCSMIVLAVLIFLPLRAVAAFGLSMVLFHNLLDQVNAEDFGKFAPIWGILHGGYSFNLLPGLKFVPIYPLVPWVGVMACGYAFGALLLRPPQQRQKWILWTGLFATVAFLIIRWLSVYGDPRPWKTQSSGLFTALSFLNCTKYPPSLCFLLMTLGPGLLALALTDWSLEKGRRKADCPFRRVANPIIVFGRVPLFYYILHVPLIHLLAGVISYPAFGSFYFSHPGKGYGFDLWVVYGVWIVVVLILYPLCKWFAGVKSRSRSVLLSYL